MTEKLKVGIAVGPSTNINQLQNKLKKTPSAEQTFLVFGMQQALDKVKDKLVDVVLICDSILKKGDDALLSELSTKTKIVLCFERDVNTIAGGFTLYSTVHVEEEVSIFELAIRCAFIGATFQGRRLTKTFDKPKLAFVFPQSKGLTKKNMNCMDSHVQYKTTQEAAKHCKVGVSTFNSTLDIICNKIEVDSRTEIVPYLCKAHWCCIDGHFRLF